VRVTSLLESPGAQKGKTHNHIPPPGLPANIETADTGPPQAAAHSAVSEPRHQAVPGSKKVVYLRFKLQKCFFASSGHTTHAVDSDDGSAGTMHHTVRVKKLINE